jgi:hypothetical protein
MAAEMHSPKKRRSRLRKAVLFVLTALVLLPFQEWAARFAMPAFDPSQQVTFLAPVNGRPILGPANSTFRQVKNTGDFDVSVIFNQHGLRDNKDVSQGNAGDFYLVGDSFPFGWGVEEKERLSERLEARIGRSVHNLSVSGDLDTYAELIAYAKGLGAPVKKVILVVTMENDIADYDAQAKAKLVSAPPARGAQILTSAKVFLTKNSALYFLATSLIHNTPWLKNIAVKLGLIRPNLAGVHAPNASPVAIRATLDRIDGIANLYDTTVVLIASRALWHGVEQAEAARVHKEVVAGLRQRGITVVDLRPAFERTGTPLDLHFANDGHWRAIGHDLAAAAIAAQLKRAGK